MIPGINNSKKSFFIWTIITTVLIAGLLILVQVDKENWGIAKEIISQIPKTIIPKKVSRVLIRTVLPILLATLLIGVGFKVLIIKPHYLHIPTEKLHAFSPDSIYYLIKIYINLIIDVIIFALSFVFSLLIGPFVYVYTVISGIILLITKKI